MWRNRISASSTVTIDDHTFPLWTDVLIPQTASATLNAPILFIDKADTNRADIKGKAIALMASTEGLNLQVSLPLRRYPALLTRKYAAGPPGQRRRSRYIYHRLPRRSPDGILMPVILIMEPTPSKATRQRRSSNAPPVLWLHATAAGMLKAPGHTLKVQLIIEHFEYPSVNVIGIAPGQGPPSSQKSMSYSAATTITMGVRHVAGAYNESSAGSGSSTGGAPSAGSAPDSIFNGADDNASVSVALLAIARAFHQQPGRRSALFIWHGAEERGLLGSRWFAAHPTVPKSSLIAVLNGDMIGRNSPDSAALLGVLPPHRNSRDLVAIGLAANKQGPHFPARHHL